MFVIAIVVVVVLIALLVVLGVVLESGAILDYVVTTLALDRAASRRRGPTDDPPD